MTTSVSFHRLPFLLYLRQVRTPLMDYLRNFCLSWTWFQQIIEGKDVNLASLLIPQFELAQDRIVYTEGVQFKLKSPVDQRLNKQLTISEFVTAFGKYKRIMCDRYPNRRPELDRYENNIIEIHNIYGSKFFEYHKLFSARSAEALRELNIKVDWSVRDNTLLNLIMAGTKTNSCSHCQSISHTSSFCPSQAQLPQPQTMNSGRFWNRDSLSRVSTDGDRYGRTRVSIDGREICNNFNAGNCFRRNCPNVHCCSKCRSATAVHPAQSCRFNMGRSAGAGVANNK